MKLYFYEQVVEIHPQFGIIKPRGSVVLKVGKTFEVFKSRIDLVPVLGIDENTSNGTQYCHGSKVRQFSSLGYLNQTTIVSPLRSKV